MISFDSIDNSEKPVRVAVELIVEDSKEEKTVRAYMYGYSELRKHYVYKLESLRVKEEYKEELFIIEFMDITFHIFADDFKYDCETMEEIYLLYPDDREIFAYKIKEYRVNFEENRVILDYVGFSLYKADENDETFNLWQMIGMENITKNMMEEHLRKLNKIR